MAAASCIPRCVHCPRVTAPRRHVVAASVSLWHCGGYGTNGYRNDQVPRVYHAGSRGTFTSPKLFKKRFVHIAANQSPYVDWRSAEGEVDPLLGV